jgi:hypothetical protein
MNKKKMVAPQYMHQPRRLSERERERDRDRERRQRMRPYAS